MTAPPGFPKPERVPGGWYTGSGRSPKPATCDSPKGLPTLPLKVPVALPPLKFYPRPCNRALVAGRRIVGSMGEEDDSTPDIEDFPIACSNCGSQMRLFAIEQETERREIYTFVCDLCGHAAARGVQTQ
jgi:hypothetical protein